MKKLPSVKAIVAITAIILINILSAKMIDGNSGITGSENNLMRDALVSNISMNRLLENRKFNNELLAINEYKVEKKEIEEIVPEIVYDGMTMEELASKLEKNLKSTLDGYGMVFAEKSIKYNVDPYLALAIVLHETGCYHGTCSTLTSQCNNIGGMKGSPGCGGGSYQRFKTLEQGIDAFFSNLSSNYYQKGLTTPETIGKKYAMSETWPSRIQYYIEIIRKS